MTANLFFPILASLALLLGLVVTYWIHSRYHLDILVSPSDLPEDMATPFISIIVPARDEARNIRHCIEGLLAQTYPHFEVIAVDDRSSDATPQILAEIARHDKRLHLLRGTDPPQGWTGKPHALAQAAAMAEGEWLCFVDADTFASPYLLISTFTAAQGNAADMFSIMTTQLLGSFWEKVILPVVFTGLSFGFPAAAVNDPHRSIAIANGQYILIKRAVYQAVGGHEAVRGRIDEDKALAQVVKGAGYRLLLADGRPLAQTRMYTSLAEMWQGWTKNIYLGMQDRLWLLFFGAVLGLIGALALPIWLVAGLVWVARAGGIPAALVAGQAVILWAYLIWKRAQVARHFDIFPFYGFTLPLGALVFTAMMLASAFKVLSGRGVTWKGRTYP